MRPPNEQEAIERVVEALAGWLDDGASEARALQPPKTSQVDTFAEVGGHTFQVKWTRSGALAAVARAVELLRNEQRLAGEGIIPLIAVPYMGEAGRRLCDEARVSWLDLSGNATITGSGLRVLIEGRPNAFARRGRPSNAFAPKSARITRWLLMNPDARVNQRELSKAVAVDEGLVSRVVSKLQGDALVVRDEQGALRVPDPDLLLEAWNEAYEFSRHEIIRGHVAARSGDALVRVLAGTFDEQAVEYAVTGLAAAWLYTHFAGFRIATFYLRTRPGRATLDELGFREEERGANVWLVLPRDEGVFQGAGLHEDVRCVHPVQAWLDLHAHPERATEAANHLRREHLNWRTDA
jgi:hypothetical protein